MVSARRRAVGKLISAVGAYTESPCPCSNGNGRRRCSPRMLRIPPSPAPSTWKLVAKQPELRCQGLGIPQLLAGPPSGHGKRLNTAPELGIVLRGGERGAGLAAATRHASRRCRAWRAGSCDAVERRRARLQGPTLLLMAASQTFQEAYSALSLLENAPSSIFTSAMELGSTRA